MINRRIAVFIGGVCILVLAFMVVGCDLPTQLCPQLEDWSTSDLIEELINRGLGLFGGD